MNTVSYKKLVPSIAWAFFILTICLIPQHRLPQQHFEREDLVIHITAYAIWSILICYGLFHAGKRLHVRQLISLWAMMALFGLLIEVLQAVLPLHRSFSLLDFMFNSIGAAGVFFQKKLNDLFLQWNL